MFLKSYFVVCFFFGVFSVMEAGDEVAAMVVRAERY